MRTLTEKEAIALCKWAIENYETNWGSWKDYPIDGCTYLQYEDNPIVIKFDTIVVFAGEKFKRIGWGRKIPGNESAITFSFLMFELKKMGISFGSYPERRFKEVIDGREYSFLIRQLESADYPCPEVCLLNEKGNIIRSGITSASKYYPYTKI